MEKLPKRPKINMLRETVFVLIFILKLCTGINFPIINTSIDNEISLQLKSQIRDHSHDTRNRDMFSVAHVNKSRSKNSLFYNGVKVWNSIPNPIKNANSLYKFKKLSKEFYLHKY